MFSMITVKHIDSASFSVSLLVFPGKSTKSNTQVLNNFKKVYKFYPENCEQL